MGVDRQSRIIYVDFHGIRSVGLGISRCCLARDVHPSVCPLSQPVRYCRDLDSANHQVLGSFPGISSPESNPTPFPSQAAPQKHQTSQPHGDMHIVLVLCVCGVYVMPNPNPPKTKNYQTLPFHPLLLPIIPPNQSIPIPIPSPPSPPKSTPKITSLACSSPNRSTTPLFCVTHPSLLPSPPHAPIHACLPSSHEPPSPTHFVSVDIIHFV